MNEDALPRGKDMRLSITILIILLIISPVRADLGFKRLWESKPGGEITSIAAMDYDRDRTIDEILVGSIDNNAYLLDKNGNLLSTFIAEGNIYGVEAFDWATDTTQLSFKKNIGLAGSWDNYVYAFYPWSGVNYFSNSNLYWTFDAEEDVHSLSAIDLGGIGYDNYVVVGVGNHLTDAGKIVVLNMNGTSVWEVTTTCVPKKAFSTVDLDHDGNMTEAVIGYCTTVDVRTESGTSVWTYTTNETVEAVHYADFDEDGEYDDVLAAAGSKLYAINNTGGLIWTFDINSTIHSITGMGRGYDLEYYLIGSGTKIIAFSGSSQSGSVLWEYESGINVTSHSRIDFDGDGKLDDIILTDGQKVYAYELGIIFPPKLEITKSVSKQNSTVGGNLEIELILKNNGYGRAENISLVDQLPLDLELVKGEITWEANVLEPFEKKSVVYIVSASKVGNYTLPRAKITFSDNYGVFYTLNSNDVIINVTERSTVNESVDDLLQLLNISTIEDLDISAIANLSLNLSNISLDNISIIKSLLNTSGNESTTNISSIQGESNKTLRPPQLSVTRSISSENLKVGENATVDIYLRNFGESSAVEITCQEVIPEEVEVLGTKPKCPEGVEPGKSEFVSYNIRPKPIKNTNNLEVNFPPLAVIFKDTSTEEILTVNSEELSILVVKESTDWKGRLFKIIPLLFGVAAILGILHKKNKIDLNKIKLPSKIFSIIDSLKNKFSKKSEVSPELGKKFMETYIKLYNERGEPPTYEELGEELSLDYGEVEKIAKAVKKKLKR